MSYQVAVLRLEQRMSFWEQALSFSSVNVFFHDMSEATWDSRAYAINQFSIQFLRTLLREAKAAERIRFLNTAQAEAELCQQDRGFFFPWCLTLSALISGGNAKN